MHHHIHARFRLNEVTRIEVYRQPSGPDGKWEIGEGVRVKLAPVQGDPFGSATPGGLVEMVIANQIACAVFNTASIGQEFDAVFSAVEVEQETEKAVQEN